jgi:hypothetical protein
LGVPDALCADGDRDLEARLPVGGAEAEVHEAARLALI